MNKCGIYGIRNLFNNKIYIGSSIKIQTRWEKHKNYLKNICHHSIKLQRAWDKYGDANFIFEIIEECEKEKLIEREQYYIDLFDSYNNGYNACPNAKSVLGIKRSDKTRKKLSLALMGHKVSEETRLKMKKPKSESHKKNMSNANKGKTLSASHVEKLIKCNTGNKYNLGKTHSEETKNIWSHQRAGRNNSKYNPCHILQFDLNNNLIKEWFDRIEVRESTFNVKHVVQVCMGKLKTAGGYIWKFKD